MFYIYYQSTMLVYVNVSENADKSIKRVSDDDES